MAYKYSIGQNEGIKRMRTIEGKIADEDKFQAWANADAERKATYGNVLRFLPSLVMPGHLLDEAADGRGSLLVLEVQATGERTPLVAGPGHDRDAGGLAPPLQGCRHDHQRQGRGAELRRKRRQVIDFSLRISPLNDNVLPLHISKLAQPLT